MHLPCHVWVWRVGSGTRWWLGRWSDPATGRSRLDRPVTGTFDRGSASPARKSGGWWRPSAISASSWPAGADWTAESDPTRYLKAAKKIKIQIILSFGRMRRLLNASKCQFHGAQGPDSWTRHISILVNGPVGVSINRGVTKREITWHVRRVIDTQRGCGVIHST